MAAKKMGKEAAMLVPSGTMANLVSMMSNTRPGDCAILEAESHIYYYEVGGISAIAGVSLSGYFNILPGPLVVISGVVIFAVVLIIRWRKKIQ